MPAPNPRRTRADAKKNAEERVLDAAEQLFGQHGLEGVSLRQIAAAAGSTNHFVVQYYFGKKERLVHAIYERRFPSLDVARGKLLAELRRAGEMENPRAILGALLIPIAEIKGATGRHHYGAFMLEVVRARPYDRGQVRHLSPLTDHLMDLLESSLPPLPPGLFQNRMYGAMRVFLSTLVDIDNAAQAGRSFGLSPEAAQHDALDTGVAVLTAPVDPSVLESARQFSAAARSQGEAETY